MKKFILKYSTVLSLIWVLIIFGLCSMPGRHIPSFKLLEMLSFDKWVHAGIFFVLCCLIFFSIIQKSNSKNPIYIFFVLAILYGCSLEVMQYYFFSQRTADWYDIIANSTGCVFGLVFYRKIYTYLATEVQ
jgi:VanZ family protein